MPLRRPELTHRLHITVSVQQYCGHAASVFQPVLTRRYPGAPRYGDTGQAGSDVVDGILFLESSLYITGEILHIDGGQIADH